MDYPPAVAFIFSPSIFVCVYFPILDVFSCDAPVLSMFIGYDFVMFFAV